ncbi:MAG: SDR family NAD(P)-dependent oxidoreductase, partial [bacterium]|nr:SDR family NAD(P)-dependent oxidoreductase [bacterium]
MSFDNQYVFVTGGTRGIGETIVKEFAACGAHVIFTGTGPSAPPWLNSLKEDYPGLVLDYRQFDFSDPSWTQSLEQVTVDFIGDRSLHVSDQFSQPFVDR